MKVLYFLYFWSSVVYNSVTLCFSDRFLQQKFIWVSYYRVFRIVVRGVGGGDQKFCGGGILLLGEGNLRRSDFDQLKSKLTWSNEFLAGGGDSPHSPSRENPVLVTFAPESFWILFYTPKVILKLYLDSKLQVTLAYYLYNKIDFSYCQILWLLKC